MLDQSNLEKTLLLEAKPETAETETQTDKVEDSFFRNDTTMTPDGAATPPLPSLATGTPSYHGDKRPDHAPCVHTPSAQW